MRQQTKPILILIYMLIGLGIVISIKQPQIEAQVLEPTATPDAEGVIYMIVQPNDSLWGIAGRARIGFRELLELNGLDENALIHPGDRLIIGYAPPPATATSPPMPPTETPTLPPPTPTLTPTPQTPTSICLLAFNDTNQNGIHEPGESLRAAVAFTIFDEDVVVYNYVTNGNSEPYCISDLKPGAYKVTRSFRPDERLTTPGEGSITLFRGRAAHLQFGSVLATEVSNSASTSQTAVQTNNISNTNNVTTQTNPASINRNGGRINSSTQTNFIIGGIIIAFLLFVGSLVAFLRYQFR